MDFPIEMIESIQGVVKIVNHSVDIAKRIADKYQQRRDSRRSSKTQDDEGMDNCFLKTLYILRQESNRKKMEYIEYFAQNTILSDSCDLDTGTILHFLNDMEQMSWRQLCFIEGLRKMYSNEIEIQGIGGPDINRISRTAEMERLTGFGYLYTRTDDLFDYHPLNLDRIYISDVGKQLADLMDLKLISLDEIAQAFGPGQIKMTVTY